jgi:uncharacterized iron-regulated protein
MKKEIFSISFFTIALLLFLTLGCCRGEWIVKTGDHQKIRFSRMIDEIKVSPLIFIGEDHDSMPDHLHQLEVIKALNEAGIPLAIGLEMFTAESQGDLDRWVAGTINEGDFALRFNANWNEPWPYYRNIFLYAREHSIPMVGINLPREISRKVSSMGFAALSPAERKEIPGPITCKVNAGYMALIRRAFAEHKLGDDAFIRFCEAQLLWNRTMAWNSLDYIKRHPGQTMVVMAGKGHAMKQGIPEEIRKMSNVDFRVILPGKDLFNSESVSEADTDYLFEE